MQLEAERFQSDDLMPELAPGLVVKSLLLCGSSHRRRTLGEDRLPLMLVEDMIGSCSQRTVRGDAGCPIIGV